MPGDAKSSVSEACACPGTYVSLVSGVCLSSRPEFAWEKKNFYSQSRLSSKYHLNLGDACKLSQSVHPPTLLNKFPPCLERESGGWGRERGGGYPKTSFQSLFI